MTERPVAKQVEFEPMPGRVVVKVFDAEERVGTLGILYAPPQELAKTTGRVIAIPEARETPDGEWSSMFAVGDIVVFGTNVGTVVTYNRETVVVLKEESILCKLHVEDLPDTTVARLVEAE